MAKNEDKKTMADRWAGLKAEFGKIVWADAITVWNQTVAVCVVSVILALLISVFDMFIQFGVDKLVGL